MKYNSYDQSGNQSPNHSQTTNWGSLQNYTSNPESAERPTKDPLQRKAEVASFLATDNIPSGNSINHLGAQEISEAYRTAIRSKDGLSTYEDEFMQQIDTPLGRNFENSRNVFSSLDYHEQKILGFLSGIGFDNYKQDHFSDLNTVVGRYPSPSALIPQMNDLLTQLTRHGNSPAKIQQYVEAFDNFEHKVYGERYEYSKAFDEIYDDANNYGESHGWAKHLNAGRPKLLFSPEPAKSQPLELSPYHNQTLDDQRVAVQKAYAENTARERAAENAKEEAINKHVTKIINSLTTGQSLTKVSDSVTNAGARQAVYEQINNSQLTTANERNFLQNITAPIHSENGPAKTYGKLSSDYEYDILAFASGNGFGQKIPTTISDVETAFDRYPTPIDFQPVEDAFLDNIQHNPNLSPEEIAKYQAALNAFKSKLYGKRQEYHEAWQRLEQDAKEDQRLQQEYIRRMQSGSMGYQPPEVQNYIENASQGQNSTSVSYPADRRAIIKPRDQDAAAAEPKKGIFGKFFGHRK